MADGTGLQPTTTALGPAGKSALGIGDPLLGLGETIKSAQTQRAEIGKKETAASKDFMGKVDPIHKDIEKTMGEQVEANKIGPEHTAIADTPKFSHTEIQGTMGTLMALAAFSGMASRQPLTMSLNAMAGLIEGANKGDQQKFENAYKTWDGETKKVVESNKQYLDKFNRIMKNYDISLSQKQEQLRHLDLEYKNEVAMFQHERMDVKARVDDAEKLASLNEKLILSKEMMADRRQRSADAARAHKDAQEAKAWAIWQDPKDGKLWSINTLTREKKEISGSEGFFKPKPGGAGGSGGSANANARVASVKAGVENTERNIEEIKQYGKGQFPTTSILFGRHAEGLISAAAYAGLRETLPKEQLAVDAKYNSMIDEAIPVFTNGLRGSDSFRQFLLNQVPQVGDPPDVANEKMRLFEANIKGTSKIYNQMFKTNPQFQNPDEGPADIPKAGGQPYDDAEKERRYQEWKARQGKK
jgi:hypothetical protein